MRNNYISKEDIERISLLACIELTEEEKEQFTKQLNEILDYFKKIDMVDTENIPPTYHVLNLTNVFREDEISPSLLLTKVIKNAVKKEKNFFKAPRIV